MIRKIIYGIVIILAIIGALFMSLFFHELTHVVQVKEPISICYLYQQSTIIAVKYNTTTICEEDYYKDTAKCRKKLTAFNVYTEKAGTLVQEVSVIMFIIILGVGTNQIMFQRKEKQNPVSKKKNKPKTRKNETKTKRKKTKPIKR